MHSDQLTKQGYGNYFLKQVTVGKVRVTAYSVL